MNKLLVVYIVLFSATKMLHADLMVGTFQNMDFETQMPPEYNYSSPDPTILANFPWKFGTQYILNDGLVLLGPVEQYSFSSSPDRSITLFTGSGGSTNSYAEIYQTGLIPSSAKSVQFSYGSSTLPKLYLDDTEISLFEISSGILAGDVEAWANQTVELEIRVYSTNPSLGSSATIDDVGFSVEAVPEPSTIALLGCATSVLFLYRNKKKTQSDTEYRRN